jgi:tetratricopeptide (TPR) repeat protein
MIFESLFGKNGDKLAQEGVDDYRKGRDEFSVIKKLEKALKLGFKNYPIDRVYLHIGSSFFDLALFDKAKEAYEKALEYNKNDHTILSNLGLTYKELGDSEKSIDFFRASLNIKPDNSYAHHNIGLYLYERGEHFLAVESLNKAIQFNPGLAVAYALKARSLAYLGHKKEALNCLKEATKKGYNNGKVLKSDLEKIDNDNPKVYWNEKKFFDFVQILSKNDKNLIDELILSLKNHKIFYDKNEAIFTDLNLTSFEIQNAIQWFHVFEKLKLNHKLAGLERNDNGEWIIDNLTSHLTEVLSSEEIAQQIVDEAIGQDFDSFIGTVSCRLKITYGLLLLNVWTTSHEFIVCTITEKEWENLNYPFTNGENGFGQVYPLATEEMVTDFLLKEE